MVLKNVITALVIAIALIAGFFLASRLTTPAAPKAALILPAPTALPEFALLDQYGQPVNRETFRNHWNLVFFGFTHCPDICPITLQVLATAKSRLADTGHEPLPRIVLVSVDPERDTPDIMRDYVAYFGEGNLGITGSVDELEKLTDALGIFFEQRPATDGNYNVDHSAAVLVINPEAEFSALFSGPHFVDNYIHDIPLLMESS